MKCYLQIGDLLIGELLKGPDLLLATAEAKEQSPDGTPWSDDEILILFRDILHALEDIHCSGVLHLDVKPENIVFVDEEGPTNVSHERVNVKLCDFDASRDAGEQTPIARGTARYLPPEVLEGHAPDEKTDIWSAGVVLFFLITGELLISEEEDDEVLRILRKPGFLDSRLSEIGNPFRHILSRLLHVNPNPRPTAREAILIVQSALGRVP
jgi:serine/threonine protein kinase